MIQPQPATRPAWVTPACRHDSVRHTRSGAAAAAADSSPACRPAQSAPNRPHTFQVTTRTVDSMTGPYGASGSKLTLGV